MRSAEPLSLETTQLIESLNQQKIRPSLETMKSVATEMGLHQFDCPVIIVAGTNGKGSCARALEALYLAHNYRVGLTSSPHLVSLTERARLNGEPTSASAFEQGVHAVQASQKNRWLSYFEFTTLASLYVIAQHQPDIVILEVGMGGRFDAANAVRSDCSIITSIDFDHQAYLGVTLDAIAFEKAGVIHAGQKGVVVTETANRSPVIQRAHSEGVPLLIPAPLVQSTQLHPMACAAALMAAQTLQHLCPIDEAKALDAVCQATLPGRFTVLHTPEKNLRFVIDIAHNPGACHALLQRLEKEQITVDHVLFSAYADKDISNMLFTFVGQGAHWHLPQIPGDKRVASADAIKALMPGEVSTLYESPQAMLVSAIAAATEGQTLLIFGGFAIAGTCLRLLESYQKELNYA
jgi:dihydrofolate synthase/folylpolyglutamate synthase